MKYVFVYLWHFNPPVTPYVSCIIIYWTYDSLTISLCVLVLGLFVFVRIELCVFSGCKIYPGHGMKQVKIDGKVSRECIFYELYVLEICCSVCNCDVRSSMWVSASYSVVAVWFWPSSGCASISKLPHGLWRQCAVLISVSLVSGRQWACAGSCDLQNYKVAVRFRE